MSKTVLLTGASGYIGKHIALQLLEAGYMVRATVRNIERSAEVADAVRAHLTNADAVDSRLTFVALDLSSDAGWSDAMAGVDVLMHTASPFPLEQPKNEDDLIRPAVDGTLRALRAAYAAGIKRVILTSSTAAISGSALPSDDTSFDETNWTDPQEPGTSPYVRSKTLAEKAAWDFIRDDASDMQLTTINPGFVLGAPLDHKSGTSIAVIARILRAKDPMLPNMGFGTVDIRDVAEAHVVAIEKPHTYGQRIMLVDRFLSVKEIAQSIKSAHPQRKVVTRVAPDFIIRFLGLFDPTIKSIVPSLGRIDKMDNARARATLGRGMRQAQKAAVATATYLIENKLV